MARAGMAKWRQGGGRGATPSLTEGGDEVQRSLELLDRVLSEFDDLENGNIEGAPGVAPQPAKAHQPPAVDVQPGAAPQPGAQPSNRLPSRVGGARGGGGGGVVVVGGGSTPEEEEEEEEEEDRSHQSEDDGYMSMNGRRVAQRPPPPPPREEEEALEAGQEDVEVARRGVRAAKKGQQKDEDGTPPPIPPLPATVPSKASAAMIAPRSPPLPPLPPAAATTAVTQTGVSAEDEDFPPPPEEAERIISTLLPRVSPGGGSGRSRGSGRGRLACGWGSLGPPAGAHRPGMTEIDPEMVGGCLVTTATQTTLPQTRHQRPYGWNVELQQQQHTQASIALAAVKSKQRRQQTDGKPPPPLPPLRFGSLPLEARPVPPAPLPPRTLPGAGERHRVVRRRDEVRLLLTAPPEQPQQQQMALFLNDEDGAPDAGEAPELGKSPGVEGEDDTFSDDSLETADVAVAPRPPPSPSYSASSTSPPGSEDGSKRRSVAWEVSLEELDALAEEEGEEGEEGSLGGTGERTCGGSEVAGMLPGSTKVVRGKSSRSRRSSSSDRSLASSEPRSVDDRSGSWRGRRSASSASVGLHLSSNEEEYSGSGLEGGGEAAAELDDMANAADMAILTSDVEMPLSTAQEGRGGPKGTYVIRKRRGRAGIAKEDEEEEPKVPKASENATPTSQHPGTTSSPECSLNSSPESDEKKDPKTSVTKTPERQPTTRPPKYFHGSRIPVLENSRIPILDTSRISSEGRSPRTPERSSPMKNVVYLSGVQPKSPTENAVTGTTCTIESHQVVVKITESGCSTVLTGEQKVNTPPHSPITMRPAELPELRKNSRPNTPYDRTPERRNAAGKLPPAPPPRTVTAQYPALQKSPATSPSAPPPETPPRTTSSNNSSSVDVTDSRTPSFDASSSVLPVPPNSNAESSSEPPPPCPSPGDKPLPPEPCVVIAVTPEGKVSEEEPGSPEATSTPIPVHSKGTAAPATTEKKERAFKSPAPPPPVQKKNPAPQPPPRPLPRVLSLPAIAIGVPLEGEEEVVEERPREENEVHMEGKEAEGEKEKKEGEMKLLKEEKGGEGEKAKEALPMEEKRVELLVEEAPIKELAIKEVAMTEEVESTKKEERSEEERKKRATPEESREEEKGERDGREKEVHTKERASSLNGRDHSPVCGAFLEDDELGCFERDEESLSRLPLQRSSTMPAVEETPPHVLPIVPSASASSFPPLPPSPVDEYCEVYDTTFFLRRPPLPLIPPPDGPLPPSPPPDSPQPPPPPPHSLAFHRPRETSLKSRSMDGGFPRGQRRTSGGSNGRRGGGEIPGERRTLPTELQGASGRRRRRDDGDRPLSPVPSPPPHAPAHLPPPPRPQLPTPPTASLPETPVFSPRKGVPAADVPRRGHMYQRRGESNGEACNMRHPSGAMTAGPGSGHCSGYSLCGTAVSSTSSTASSSPFPGGLGPARGWYPRHRHHNTPQTSTTSGHHHHLHPAHNRPRPASTEHLDRLAAGPAPTAWDLHGYGPARTVVGGGTAAGGLCTGPGVGARKPLTLPPNLTPKFFHRSPREALRRVTSLLIRKGSTSKEAGRRDAAAGASGSVAVTSPTAAGPSSPPPASASGESPDGTRGKRGFFKSFWKRSRHYSLEHQ